jgi:hypothetical protein
MKSEPLKSVTMKSNAQATPYFSAYPLKALRLSSPETVDHNKIQTSRVIGRSRILPMANPYAEKRISINKIKLPANIQSADDNWFNNYE